VEGEFTVLRGEAMMERYAPFRANFAEAEFVPIIHARSIPGGSVEYEFYQAIKSELIQGLQAGAPWDGVFLDMHGAVNVYTMDDAEGDWIAAVREVVGAECMIAASYDLHGNVSKEIVDHLDILTAFRTAPHVDVIETVERACRLLVDSLKRGARPHKAFIRVPVILPGEVTSTEWQPGERLYGIIPGLIDGQRVLDASILVGYVWADEPRASASVLALGTDAEAANAAARTLAEAYWKARSEFQFGVPALPMDECIEVALSAPETPVFISDSGDNPTAGGVGDVPALLERLIALDVPNAVFASIADEAAVRVCHQAGVGAQVDLSLGGKLDPINGKPLAVSGVVERIETFDWKPGLYNRQAVVRVGGVRVIVTERRTPFHYEADFQRLGVEPTEHQVVVVKIGYLVPDLKRMAQTALLAFSPGAVDQFITRLPFQRVERPIYPLDPDMTWRAENAD
jgi:microcystin degradation protein MlrC